ncbi:hypothetical protein [Mesorhizobium sp. B2-3-4]|uniref:hypothetical protein n=1 Tax=Mesorhizobium sp. B2-3-4 TaxID=2589959 RepID=UPI00112D8505|nr:hypothetical protein [Mesorhizobium sp. B2-3-4]TPM31855.1 hypothetical protein FJ967_24095 [Mesorhizobium sp. B2-3-4]
MNSVPTPMAAIAGMAAMAVIPGVVAIADTDGLTMGARFWRRQNHAPKEKENDHAERQQQDCEMYPPGLGHPASPLFPHHGRQINSTKWMRSS